MAENNKDISYNEYALFLAQESLYEVIDKSDFTKSLTEGFRAVDKKESERTARIKDGLWYIPLVDKIQNPLISYTLVLGPKAYNYALNTYVRYKAGNEREAELESGNNVENYDTVVEKSIQKLTENSKLAEAINKLDYAIYLSVGEDMYNSLTQQMGMTPGSYYALAHIQNQALKTATDVSIPKSKTELINKALREWSLTGMLTDYLENRGQAEMKKSAMANVQEEGEKKYGFTKTEHYTVQTVGLLMGEIETLPLFFIKPGAWALKGAVYAGRAASVAAPFAHGFMTALSGQVTERSEIQKEFLKQIGLEGMNIPKTVTTDERIKIMRGMLNESTRNGTTEQVAEFVRNAVPEVSGIDANKLPMEEEPPEWMRQKKYTEEEARAWSLKYLAFLQVMDQLGLQKMKFSNTAQPLTRQQIARTAINFANESQRIAMGKQFRNPEDARKPGAKAIQAADRQYWEYIEGEGWHDTRSDAAVSTKTEAQSPEERIVETPQKKQNGWANLGLGELFENLGFGKGTFSEMLRNPGKVFSGVPDDLLRGKSNAMLPLMLLLFAGTSNGTILPMLFLLLMGGSLKHNYEANTKGKVSDMQQSMNSQRFQIYADEPLNKHITSCQLQGNVLFLEIGGMQVPITLKGDTLRAVKEGALPPNVLANKAYEDLLAPQLAQMHQTESARQQATIQIGQ